ncbi:hypothetical protein V8G54_015293 [Vigna mungo]|uniref:Uncharacterized protein n=1 Tax=Vigna mungo TaxID=3915 RepID=A0AAQ3NM38_VIGMU
MCFAFQFYLSLLKGKGKTFLPLACRVICLCFSLKKKCSQNLQTMVVDSSIVRRRQGAAKLSKTTSLPQRRAFNGGKSSTAANLPRLRALRRRAFTRRAFNSSSSEPLTKECNKQRKFRSQI